MEIRQCFLTNNDCYVAGRTIIPKGIIVHSTAADNPFVKRYVQPDDGRLGVNNNHNDWNRSGVRKCVHAFIGKDKNGQVCVYQTLPWTMRCWGCGSGNRGSYNNSYIQFEICEDALTDAAYFNECFKVAAELCKYLMATYFISADNVISHHEAHLRGHASNHADCDHWLSRFGKSMNWFRSQLTGALDAVSSFKVKVTADVLNVRSGASVYTKIVTQIKRGELYTIVGTSGDWGRLKSGAGWINLKYTVRC